MPVARASLSGWSRAALEIVVLGRALTVDLRLWGVGFRGLGFRVFPSSHRPALRHNAVKSVWSQHFEFPWEGATAFFLLPRPSRLFFESRPNLQPSEPGRGRV